MKRRTYALCALLLAFCLTSRCERHEDDRAEQAASVPFGYGT